MRTLMFAAVCGLTGVCHADGIEPQTDTLKETEQTDGITVSGGASVDLVSGYVLYGARLNDEMTLMKDARLDFSYEDWGYVGGYVWCNSDLTHRRHSAGLGKAFNEYDFYVHYGNTFSLTETVALSFELAHVWYWYPARRHGNGKGYGTTHELRAYAELATPWVTPYAFIANEYLDVHGTVLYGGLKRAFDVTEAFSLTPDAQVIGMSENYMGMMFPWKAGGTERCDAGVAAVQVSLKAEYALTPNLRLRGTVAYVVTASDDVRGAISDDTAGFYRKDFVWGMIGCALTF